MGKGYAEGPAAEEAERRRAELAAGHRRARAAHPARGRGLHTRPPGASRDRVGSTTSIPTRCSPPARRGAFASSVVRPLRAKAIGSGGYPAQSVAKRVEQLERVIIRFAGDSGDGMQLTGDRFSSETATLGNDLATFPDYPAEIRAPAGSLPGVSGFQVHFADHDILTPGDRPDVLVAMNPAALKTNLRDLPKGGTVILNTDAFNERALQKAGLCREPARGRLAGRLPPARGRADVDDGRGAEGDRRDHLARGRALEELLRARADVVALSPPDRRHARVHRRQVREAPLDRRGEHAGVQGGLELRGDLRGLRRLVRGGTGEARAGHLSADHRERGALDRVDRGREAARVSTSFSAPTRSRLPRRSSRSSLRARTSA